MSEQPENTEHEFAQYIRILGKGRNGQRPLTMQEAYAAMSMIYCYDVEPEQLGAFLMLMRVKEETAAEVAGFVQAIRDSIPLPDKKPEVAIDWPSYAGKRRHLPWYLLAAVMLSQNGYPVFMHGLSREDERVYTSQVLELLGIRPSQSLPGALGALHARRFAYLDIEQLSPLTGELLETRDLLGLRSPLHTVARMLNPMSAKLSLLPVFHPNYAQIHQQAAKLLGERNVIAFKGEGGEAERVPDRATTVFKLQNNIASETEWPALLPPGKYGRDKFPDLDHFMAVYEEKAEDPYGTLAVIGTMALCIEALEQDCTPNQALERATMLWDARVELTATA